MKAIIYMTLLVSISFAGMEDGWAKKKKKKKSEKMEQTTSKKSFKRAYGMAGCGLGSIVMGADGGQVSAATTNGTGWNKVFGITFGTSNCIDDASANSAQNIDNFIRGNEVALATDVARGQGETLAALGDVMGCSDKAHLGEQLKQNYSEIFSKSGVSTMRMTDSMITVILNDESLKSQCSKVNITI